MAKKTKKGPKGTGFPKMDAIIAGNQLADKIDKMRALVEGAVNDLDWAFESLDDEDVKGALETVRAKWQTLDHATHAEATASRLTSIAEDLAEARAAVLVRVKGAIKEAKKAKKTS